MLGVGRFMLFNLKTTSSPQTSVVALALSLRHCWQPLAMAPPNFDGYYFGCKITIVGAMLTILCISPAYCDWTLSLANLNLAIDAREHFKWGRASQRAVQDVHLGLPHC